MNLITLIGLIDSFFWSYVGWTLILFLGLYFTFYSGFVQVKIYLNLFKLIRNFFLFSSRNFSIHSLKLFYLSIGGMVGIGNIVFISHAIVFGGPGCVLWILLASFLGSLVKYAEIFLGIQYKVVNRFNKFCGGPMFFLQKAFQWKYISYVFALLLCCYSVELFNFVVIVDRINLTFGIDKHYIICILLFFILLSTICDFFLINICCILMPIFICIYFILFIVILLHHIYDIPALLQSIFIQGICGSNGKGYFYGTNTLVVMYLGISKTVYSGDIGIGYDSIIQSNFTTNSKKQAILSIYALCFDTIICLCTSIIILLTKSWYKLNHIHPANVILYILSDYIPYSDFLVTILFFFAGYTTIITYLVAGLRSADFINPCVGKGIYLLYCIFIFYYFSYFPQKNIMTIMGLLSGLLLLINVVGIFKLRKNIRF